ncbi:hypothetical protein DFH07DRAFT_963835 [Mycena maculata]|uniref:Uncharacterized protein n=1 Tax=Mycena maculata TaxID=230809 RepID=A0AAD7IJH7_9AGAR|nr:hypothetical protein DFH07DRAFT_963835 [Mycena maculata]
MSELNDILSACRGIRTLVLSRGSVSSILASLGAVRLRRLGLFLTTLFSGTESIDLAHPTFTFVTHLNIFDPLRIVSSRFPGFSWSSFPLIPALTHLALDDLNNPSVANEIFANCRQLEVLVSVYRFESDHEIDDLLSIDDARFWISRLPTIDKLGVAVPQNVDANSIAASWLQAFSAAIAVKDIAGLLSVFQPDALWRDILTPDL